MPTARIVRAALPRVQRMESTMTTLKDYEQRALKWALQGSTILGIASVVTAATGTGVDAVTGQPWVAAAIGIAAGGVAAILLPQKDPAPIAAGMMQIAVEISSHKADMEKAIASAEAAARTVSSTVPKLAQQAQAVTSQVEQLRPAVEAVAALSGKPEIACAIGKVGQVLDGAEVGLKAPPST